MRIKNLVLNMCCLLISTVSFAQIQKNAWGMAGIFETYYVKRKVTVYGDTYKGHATGINISPTFNYCVSNRWMLNASARAFLPEDSAYDDYYSIAGSVRYYFTPQKKWKIYSQLMMQKDYTEGSNLSMNFSLGANQFLNPHIALNMNINVGGIIAEREPISNDSYVFFKANFENLNTFKRGGDTVTSTEQKKLSIGGHFLTSYHLEDKDIDVILAPEIAYYILPKVMVGTDIHASINSFHKQVSLPLLRVFGRYYIPIKKWDIFAEAHFHYSYNTDYFNSLKTTNYGASLGVSYALNNHIALEGTVLNLNKIKKLAKSYGTSSPFKTDLAQQKIGPSIKLRYFIR